MRFINTKIHGYMDYAMAILLIISPWLFGFYQGGAESWVPIILGAGVIVYSLITDYELSATKNISMKTHLTLDLMGGLFLAVSPWLFGFAEVVYLPHLIFGIAEVGAALMTETEPQYEKKMHHAHHHH